MTQGGPGQVQLQGEGPSWMFGQQFGEFLAGVGDGGEVVRWEGDGWMHRGAA